MSETILQRAQRSLAIQDVYLCDANVWASRKHDPGIQLPSVNSQFKLNPANECAVDEVTPPQNDFRYMVRYFVGTGLRILNPSADLENANLTREDLIAEIEATFVVRYAVIGRDHPLPEMLEAFNDHAVHHMWPYWREFLQATTLRLRVPPVVLPMRIATPSSVFEPQLPATLK